VEEHNTNNVAGPPSFYSTVSKILSDYELFKCLHGI